MENEIVAFAKNLAETNPAYAYIFFFINSVLQILFPPYPGDTLIVFQGYLSSTGLFNPFLLLLTSLSATYLSSIFLYTISLKFGHTIVSNKFIQRYFNLNKISRLEDWFEKYGPIAIIINKFLPGVGSLTLIAAGLFKLSPVPAFISIGAASVLQNTLLFMAGRVTGNNVDFVKSVIREYYEFIIIGSAIIAGLYVYVRYIYKNRKRAG